MTPSRPAPEPPRTFAHVERAPRLADTVAAELTEAIVARQFEPGTPLPPERELGTQFRVSRTVIREAVRTLEARGLVTVTSGRRVEVVGFDSATVAESMRLFVRGQQAFDYRQVHEVRRALEVRGAGLAAARATPADVQGLRELCSRLADAVADADFRTAGAVDFEFHQALAAATGNELFLIMFDSISEVFRDVRDKAYATYPVGATGLRAHLDVLGRIEARDADGARLAMTEHLAHAESVWLRDGGGPP